MRPDHCNRFSVTVESAATLLRGLNSRISVGCYLAVKTKHAAANSSTRRRDQEKHTQPVQAKTLRTPLTKETKYSLH